MEDVEGLELRQSKRKKIAKEFYYLKVLHGNELVERSLLKELELTLRKTVRREVVSRKVQSFDKAQRKRTDDLKRMVKISEEQSVVSETCTENNNTWKRKKGESGSASRCGPSGREASRPGVNIGYEEKVVRAVWNGKQKRDLNSKCVTKQRLYFLHSVAFKVLYGPTAFRISGTAGYAGYMVTASVKRCAMSRENGRQNESL